MRLLNSTRIKLAAIVAIMLASGLSPARAAGPTAQGPTRIAVANVPLILTQLREAKDLDEKFKAEKERLAAEEVKLKETIKNLEGQSGNFRPDSPQYEDLQKQYVEAVAKYKVWGETVTFDMDLRKKRLTRMLYDKITAAVGEYAAREGIDMVLSDVKPMLTEQALAKIPLEQLSGVLNQQRVLFAGKSNDISQAVIALLDSKYGGAGAVGGTGGTGGVAGQGAGAGPASGPATASGGASGPGAGSIDARPAAAADRPVRSNGTPRRNGSQ